MYNQPPGPHHDGQQDNNQMQMQMHQMQQQINQLEENNKPKGMPHKLEEFEFGVFIKQKFDLLEAMTGCERANEYKVYKRNKEGKKSGDRQFKYKEKSSYYERQCLAGSCKPFRQRVKNCQGESEDDSICMRCEKECKCSYYCCNRAEMLCYYTEEEDQTKEKYLGKCYDPWDMCNYTFRVYTDADPTATGSSNIDYTIKASCCQIYFWCKCPCKACNEVLFMIHDGDAGEVVGELRKKGIDCATNVLMGDDADNFLVDFPKNSNWRQRAMLMNLAIFIDYTMFEDTSENQQHQTG